MSWKTNHCQPMLQISVVSGCRLFNTTYNNARNWREKNSFKHQKSYIYFEFCCYAKWGKTKFFSIREKIFCFCLWMAFSISMILQWKQDVGTILSVCKNVPDFDKTFLKPFWSMCVCQQESGDTIPSQIRVPRYDTYLLYDTGLV